MPNSRDIRQLRIFSERKCAMKKPASILAAAALGSLLAVGATTASMARDGAAHRTTGDHVLRCNDGPAYDRGFGGFSGTPGHTFMGPDTGKDWGTDWGVNNWAIDPFWGQGYGYYDGMAYIVPGPHGHSMGKSVRRGGSVRHCL
jgi:hypothetical protein